MNHTVLKRILRKSTFVLMAILLLAAPSFAATFNLRAAPTTVIMPDGNPVVMWGFCQSANNPADCTNFTVPGPLLTVPVGDSNLTINLKNDLPVATSLVIPGLQGTLALATFTDTQGRDRVRSFAAETAAGGSGTYTFTAKPGTYLYQSGTHPAVQVQMGLYGAVKNDAAIGQAYAGKAYNSEVVLLYSEIDSALHDAVANNRYGQPVPLGGDPALYPSSTLDYKADYFLINGQPFKQGVTTPLPAADAGQTTLIRFLNAGLRSHIPTLLGSHMKLIAEDGNLYPYSREQYSVLLPAGKTIDALWTPTCGDTYKLYDRSLHLSTGGQPGGGMLAYLQVGGAACTPLTVNLAPVISSTPILTSYTGVSYSYDVDATDPEGTSLTYSLTTSPAGMIINSSVGLIQWTPQVTQTGSNPVTVRVTDADGMFSTQSFTITVTDNPPTITSSAITSATIGVAYTYDVDATDSDIQYGGDSLTFSLTTFPTGMTINPSTGLIQWTPTADQAGSNNVTVRVTDLAGLFATQSFTITVPAPPAIMHIGDLDPGTKTGLGGNRWRTGVIVTVHNQSEGLVSGATVTGSWSAGDTNGRTLSCTTSGSGTCTVTSGRLNRTTNPSVIFTVNNVAATGATYNAVANHDPDLNSNGTSITINWP